MVVKLVVVVGIETVAVALLKTTVLSDAVVLKLVPVMITSAPTVSLVGVKEAMAGMPYSKAWRVKNPDKFV